MSYQLHLSRYAPKVGMQAIWTYILKWVEGEKAAKIKLEWEPDVRPSYTSTQKLPVNAGRLAVQRGSDWHTNAKMLLNEQGWEEYKKLWNLNDSNMLTTVEVVDNAGPQPEATAGDGSFGVLEYLQCLPCARCTIIYGILRLGAKY